MRRAVSLPWLSYLFIKLCYPICHKFELLYEQRLQIGTHVDFRPTVGREIDDLE